MRHHLPHSVSAMVMAALVSFLLPLGAVHASGAQQAKINTYPKHGTVLFSDWQFPDTLNPLQTSIGVSAETYNTMFSELVVLDQQAHLKPDLLVNIPSVKNHEILNGGLTIVLKLKPHQYWSSGVEITSKDVWFGWKMDMDPATGPACLGTCDHIKSIALPDKYTAVLHLKDHYAPILTLGIPAVWPHSWSRLGLTPHAAALTVAKDTKFNFEDNTYWTSGPYQVQTFVNNDRITLTPMKYYHVHPGPYVARLIFVFYSDKNAMVAAAGTGQTDVTTDYTLADVPILNQHQSTFKTMITPAFLIENLQINQYSPTYNGAPNPLRDVRVRQALALSLDKIGVIRSALSVNAATARNVVAYTPFVVTAHYVQPYADTSIKGAWDPYLKKYVSYSAQAVSDAKKLMAAAGYANGFPLDFVTTTGNVIRTAEYAAIAKYWEQIGVHASLRTIPPDKLFADWNGGGVIPHEQFQIGMWSIGTSPDPDSLKIMISSKFIDADKVNHSTTYQDWSGIRDQIIDRNMDQAAATINHAVRAKLYRQVQEKLSQNAYLIQIYYRPAIVTADHKVTGVTAPPFFGNDTWNTYTWHTVQ